MGDFVSQLDFPVAVWRGSARHHHQMPGLRLPAQRLVDGAGKIILGRDANHIGGQWRERPQKRPGNTQVDHGNSRKQFGAMVQQESECFFAPDDQHIRRSQGVFVAQERSQGANVGVTIEAG